MAPIPGWYADPRDASRLRYWDGAVWTEHLAPRQPPLAVAEATPVTAAAPAGTDSATDLAAAAAPAPAPAAAPAAAPSGADPATAVQWRYPGAAESQQTWEYGAPPAQAAYGSVAGSAGPRTPDGVPISSWLKRFAARLLDGIFVLLLSLPLTGYFLYRYVEAVMDQVDSTTGMTIVPSDEALRWELPAALIALAVQAVYEAVSLRLWSATPGKRVVGISVRLLDEPGRLEWPVIVRRVGFLYGVSLLSVVPIVSLVAGIVWLLDYLWPLWNKPRQALHDKAAGTVVVEGPARPVPMSAP